MIKSESKRKEWREDGKKRTRLELFFCLPFLWQLSFSSFSIISFPCLFFLHCFSYLRSFFSPHVPLAPLLFSSPLLHLCVMSRSWGESTWDFPTAWQEQTQPHTHSFSVSPSTPSVSCQRGVLRKTTHTPPPSILDVCWNFMLHIVPQTSTVCCYGDRIGQKNLCLWIRNEVYAIKHLFCY